MRWLLRGLSLIIELALLVTGFSLILGDDESQLDLMALWDLLAIGYLGLGLLGTWLAVNRVRLPDPDAKDEAAAGMRSSPPKARFVGRRLLGMYWGLLPVLFSLLGVTAALNVLFINAATGDGTNGNVMKGAGAVAMVSAWLLLHVSYARRYQWFYERDGGGLEFPGPMIKPSEIDFLYFAMTLGSSFATSDVNVTSTKMRWHVLFHSVLSFFYNAIVLAVGFRILTGG